MQQDEQASLQKLRKTVEANREVIVALKLKNKELKEAHAQSTQQATCQPGKSAVEAQLDNDTKYVQALRRRHDKLVDANKKKKERLVRERDALHDLLKQAAPSSEDKEACRAVRLAENHLDKTMRQLTEAADLGDTYRRLLETLKHEEAGLNQQLDAVTEALDKTEGSICGMQRQVRAEAQARAAAMAAVKEARAAAAQRRTEQAAAVAARKADVVALLSARKTVLQQVKNGQQSLAQLRRTSSGGDAGSSSGGGEGAVPDLDPRNAWLALVDACSITDLKDLDSLPNAQAESRGALMVLQEDGRTELARLHSQIADVRQKLDPLKEATVRPASEVSADLEAELRAATERQQAAKREGEESAKALALVVAGVDGLQGRCRALDPARTLPHVSADSLLQVLKCIKEVAKEVAGSLEGSAEAQRALQTYRKTGVWSSSLVEGHMSDSCARVADASTAFEGGGVHGRGFEDHDGASHGSDSSDDEVPLTRKQLKGEASARVTQRSVV